ncbi:hypothetical protein MKX03_014143 [Papaver bracteatum]|nr:hypothetical protein MKX03_014143 [Papaver bracteatum]
MEISLALQHNIGKSDFLSIGPEKMCNKRPITASSRMNNICNSLSVERKTNYYEVLSLDANKNVDYEEIKKAYRRMALQCHPDICPDPSRKQELTQRFVELRKAYETLSDPVSRYNYDCEEVTQTSKFPKSVWENQLSGLKTRSHSRMQKKQKN